MRINSNIPALNANRILGRNTKKMSNTLERLSSGKRINQAADDAAGMAIFQKMKAQIRGLQQASRNSLDGISMIQTGEGALDEIHSMLQRMRELSVQAANGIYGEDDLNAILDEIGELTEQIEDVSIRTDFNGIKILSGGKLISSNKELSSAKLEVGKFENLVLRMEEELKDIESLEEPRCSEELSKLFKKKEDGQEEDITKRDIGGIRDSLNSYKEEIKDLEKKKLEDYNKFLKMANEGKN